jgi:hypothetical protein
VAGFATWSGSAGHAGATASIKLTFDLDHSMWAAQSCTRSNDDYDAFDRRAAHRPHCQQITGTQQ